MRPLAPPFRATYRLQLHEGFGFGDALRLLPYLDDLGVSHLYLSPVLESARGSLHGYDGTDPARVSRERGGERGLRRLLRAIERPRPGRSVEGVVLDIVPNHLAASWQNPYWRDLLANGRRSRYRRHFDVSGARLRLPVLEDTLERVVARGLLRVRQHPRLGLVLAHGSDLFPLSAASARELLRRFARETARERGKAARPGEGARLRRWLAGLDEGSRLRLCRAQAYRLEPWREGAAEINYRRFFDINQLVAVRAEDPAVFEWLHAKILALRDAHSSVHGLRVDHVDGLTDPKQYLERLRRRCEYVWVEKITSEDETLPYDWPVRGSTGYDFVNSVSKLFVHEDGYRRIHDFYAAQVDSTWALFPDCVYASKKEVLARLFPAELGKLAQGLHAYAMLSPARERRFTRAELGNALVELTACLRTYRIYAHAGASTLGQDDRRWLFEAYEEALQRKNVVSPPALEWLVGFFLEGDRAGAGRRRRLTARWQQLSGPVMAKGLEDTALYRYFPLLSLNAVGGQPDWSYNNVLEFHSFNEERLRSHPLTWNASTTHDTKRDEDVRARIHVLSEMPSRWIAFFETWSARNRALKDEAEGRPAPSRAFEYYVYQTLLGAWPLDGKVTPELRRRLQEHFLKAAREGKRETSWLDPSPPYEAALRAFTERLLDPALSRRFLAELGRLAARTAYFGAISSLGELTLKMFSPGLPDTYQGTETWSYRLTDPDNRAPVDYGRLRRLAARARRLEQAGSGLFPPRLARGWRSGELKYRWVRWCLGLRRKEPVFFQQAKYIPLRFEGPRGAHALGFARALEHAWLLVIVPRFLAGSGSGSGGAGEALRIPPGFWGGTRVELPLGAPARWENLASGRGLQARNAGRASPGLRLREVFGELPVAVLASRQD